MTRRAIVHRISASAPDDVSGIEAAIASQRIDPKGVIAVLAKTEGNGLVNDFSRGHASLALSLLFERQLSQQPLRFLLRQSAPNHLVGYSPLAIKLVAFGKVALI